MGVEPDHVYPESTNILKVLPASSHCMGSLKLATEFGFFFSQELVAKHSPTHGCRAEGRQAGQGGATEDRPEDAYPQGQTRQSVQGLGMCRPGTIKCVHPLDL